MNDIEYQDGFVITFWVIDDLEEYVKLIAKPKNEEKEKSSIEMSEKS